MNLERIEFLCGLLPDNCAYLKFSGADTGSPSNRMAARFSHCCFDPGFGWQFVSAFLETGEELPCNLYAAEGWLPRAYDLEYRGGCNPHLAHAIMLESPRRKGERDLLRALLIIPDLSPEGIAEILHLPPESIAAFEQLFWNVRDRLDDAAYLKALVYPGGRLVELRRNYATEEDPGALMLRAAFNGGLEAVRAIAGLRLEMDPSPSPDEAARQLTSMIMNGALMMARCGFLNQKDIPVLKLALTLAKGRKQARSETRDHDAMIGLKALSIGYPVLATIANQNERDVKNRRAALRAMEAKGSGDQGAESAKSPGPDQP